MFLLFSRFFCRAHLFSYKTMFPVSSFVIISIVSSIYLIVLYLHSTINSIHYPLTKWSERAGERERMWRKENKHHTRTYYRKKEWKRKNKITATLAAAAATACIHTYSREVRSIIFRLVSDRIDLASYMVDEWWW